MARGGPCGRPLQGVIGLRPGAILRGSVAWLATAFLCLLASAGTALAQANGDPAQSIGQADTATAEQQAPDIPAATLTPPEATGDFAPLIKPRLTVARAEGEIDLDGELDDPGWVNAARATGFSTNFPDEMAEPDVASEVWVTYDDKSIYFAFIAYDDPSTIRSSLRDRDEIWQDDYFGILLDTYGDATWAYYLFANPLGIQGDTRFAITSGEDSSFDLLYYSEGKITDFGYVVEMRVPFASMRFPDAPEQEWRATFWRTRPRASREQHTWAAISRDDPCFLCQYGTLEGIQGVKPGGALELLPTLVASQQAFIADSDDPSSGLDNEGVKGDPSLGIRYSFPVGITADMALNPDFSQIESDAGQIDVNTTFALFFPERRRLFQEGSDVFDTPIDQVYTRSINDPKVVGKAIGRMNRTTLGYIGGLDETSPILIPFEEKSFVGQTEQSVSNILRGQQTFLEDSYVGALFTDRRFVDHGGSNTSLGVDGQIRLFGNYRFEFQFVGTQTTEPNDTTLTEGINDETFARGRYTSAYDGESFWGTAAYASIERNARTWNFDFDYWQYSPTFRVDNGFETRNDSHSVSMFQGLNFWPEGGFIDRWGPGLFARREWNHGGVKKRDYAQVWINSQLKGQTTLEPAFSIENELFRGVEFNGLKRVNLFVNSNFSDPLRLGLFVSYGERIARNTDAPELGTGTSGEVWGTIKLFTRFVLEPSIQYSDLFTKATNEEVFKGFIFRTRANFQFTRELFLRLVVQWDDFDGRLDVEPLITYRLNPFSVFFIGATSGYDDYGRNEFDPGDPTAGNAGLVQTQRQFFAKFQYLLRF